MQRTYEVMFIVRPDLTEEDTDKLIATLQGHATTAGATVLTTEKMGRRRLAYDVKKFSDGQYVLLTVNADGKAIHELERRLRVAEPVIKFITVRTDEDQQRLDKVKKLRESKKRRPVEPAAAPESQSPSPAVNA
ncbi:MAG TPA: 30S ribosomal protein S6 [Verrucomicrobiae bacterium]|nr:30S ribosomal protein S6 [Verrucomicrobiae bacterium]